MQKEMKYKIYLPKHMWGNIFNSVFANLQNFELEDFDIGGRNSTIETDTLIRTTLNEAKKDLDNNLLPIIVFPIASIFRYTNELNDGKTDFPKIKIIGPAFKSRDDIFLFRGKNKTFNKKDCNINIVRKGADITTTSIARMFNKDVLNDIVDPIFNVQHKDSPSFKWDYKVDFIKGDYKSVEKSKELYGCIAAGSELKEFWENHYWITAVNLNAWICNKYNITYLPRSVFVTLFDDFSTNEKEINKFWDLFTNYSFQWHSKLQEDKPEKINGYYFEDQIALPTQIPAIIQNGYDYIKEVADDLIIMDLFLEELYHTDNLSEYNRFDCSIVMINKGFIKWELLRKTKKNNIEELINNDIIKEIYHDKDDDELKIIFREFTKVKNDFVDYNMFDIKYTINTSLKIAFVNCMTKHSKDIPKNSLMTSIFDKFVNNLELI